ncbi:MAG: hypothetical protein L3J31_03465 [Bacteroidales bacterium]|nr:hypothetical protein [Bacteroidales bacterium]MCF6341849.1 hypothetical protein [Bacteroidales bacterium]
MKRLYFFVFFIVWAVMAVGQPPEIYFGGIGDGFHFVALTAGSTIYGGGASDGFAAGEYLPGTSIFEGGNSDGFASNLYLNPASIFVSAASDGFSLSAYSNTNLITLGGDGDGFSTSRYLNTNLITLGGDGDGFDSETLLYYHYWTGLVGTGWLVAGNWVNNIVPDENARVIIPAGVPNFPGVNIGTFTIGAASGKFKCRELLIEAAAQLTTRINAVTEIYSKVEIKGLMLVKNRAANAFRVIGGTVNVSSGGELRHE